MQPEVSMAPIRVPSSLGGILCTMHGAKGELVKRLVIRELPIQSTEMVNDQTAVTSTLRIGP